MEFVLISCRVREKFFHMDTSFNLGKTIIAVFRIQNIVTKSKCNCHFFIKSVSLMPKTCKNVMV